MTTGSPNPLDLFPEPEGDEDREAYVRQVHDRGLGFDLAMMSRRRMLLGISGAGVLALAGGLSPSTAAAACLEEVEFEDQGPYPADGSNGLDLRTTAGVVRSDITASFGTSKAVAKGVKFTFSFIVQDLNCKPLAGAAVYVWHCDAAGLYSLYSTGLTGENYLRGIQAADANGKVTFTSIFPGCYSGRWPHIHFEIYSSVADATSGKGPIRQISQMAIPKTAADAVYATSGYEASVAPMSKITLATDGVFKDDLAARELSTVTGSVSAGYVSTLTVTIDPKAVVAVTPGFGSAPVTATPTSSPSATPTATPSASPTPTLKPTPTPTRTAAPTAAPAPAPTAAPTASATPWPTPPSRHHGRRHHHRFWWWPFK